jgi:GntR family transcriptional regulator
MYRMNGDAMPITAIISNASPKPIYLQIEECIRAAIMSGEAKAGEELPSIRRLAQDLRVSVITTKRAYDDLERELFIVTSPGRGSYVAEPNLEFVREARLREAEAHMAKAVDSGRAAGVGLSELRDMLDIAWKGEGN